MSLKGIVKKASDPGTYDHPVVFLVFLAFAFIPVIILLSVGMEKVGLPSPVSLLKAAN